MTAKIKAREILNEMAIKFHDGTTKSDLKPNFKIAENKYFRECSLIAVDEIVKELEDIAMNYEVENLPFLYWRMVRIEIENS